MSDQARKLIEDLGGATSLAAEITERASKTVQMGAVAMWKAQGIPHKWRRIVSEIAQEKGVTLPANYWSLDSGREVIRKTRERRAG